MKNIILLLFLGINAISYSQTITINDSVTKKPLELVSISSENPKAYTITNSKGQANISAFKNSEKINIQILGYKKEITSYSSIQTAKFEVFLTTESLNMDEVVISATRWRQSSNNIPLKISSISPKEVELQNPQTAADLLTVSGKVFVQKSQQGGGSPMIRGFATNRLLYTVDGIRMNTAIFRSGNIQNVINLDPFAIENTEIMFGPGSLIYGSDAIGGVMSFQTLVPQFSYSNKLLIKGKSILRYSSANNEKTGHFDVNLGFEKWAFITSFSSWNYDNLRQGSNGPNDYLKPFYVQTEDNVDRVITQNDILLQIPSAYSQINLMQKIRFKPNDNWDFQYGFHYSETSPFGRYDRHNRMKNNLPRYAEWNYGPQKWMMNNLNVTNESNNTIYNQMTLRLAIQSFEESRIDRSFNKTDENYTKEMVDAYSLNVDFAKVLNTKNTLFYGVEYIYNNIKSFGSVTDISTKINTKGPSRYPQSKWSSIAAFVNDEFRMLENVTIQAGLRYNQFILDSDFGKNLDFYLLPFKNANINNGSLTGSIGAVYRPTENWVISTNFGTAFRSPNVDDIGKIFDSEPGSVTIPNPNLEAETAYNFDLSFAKIFGNFLKFDVTGYYTILQNAMVRRDFQLNGLDSIMYDGSMSRVQAIQNAAKAYVYGIQAGLEVKFAPEFSFSSDLNYQVGEEELDDGSKSSSRHAAPLFGTTRLNFKYDKLSLEFYVNYQAERKFEDLPSEEQSKDEIYAKDKNGNNYSPVWYTLNLKALYLLNDTFTISSGIENLTDQRYRPYSSGISALGRNFIFSLRTNF